MDVDYVKDDDWPCCETCGKLFPTDEEACDHMYTEGHWENNHECHTCDLGFPKEEQSNTHMREEKHQKYICDTCEEEFPGPLQLYSHIDEEKHGNPRVNPKSVVKQKKTAKDEWENYCQDCKRVFKTSVDFKQHRAEVHGEAKITCPFCNLGCASLSALSYHLDARVCPSTQQLDREQIFALLSDIDHTIEYDQLKWCDHVSWREYDDGMIVEAPDRAWNGRAWECYLCNDEFQTPDLLTFHLNTKHARYICPNQRCEEGYNSIKALFNHLEEDDVCRSFRFKQRRASRDVDDSRS